MVFALTPAALAENAGAEDQIGQTEGIDEAPTGEEERNNDSETDPVKRKGVFLPGFLILTLAPLGALAAEAAYSKKHPQKAKERAALNEYMALSLILLSAMALRIFIGFASKGHGFDTKCFMCWGNWFRTEGFRFYANDWFHDYPPLYMIILGGMDALRVALGIGLNTVEHLFLIKLFPSICDLVGAYFFYRIARRKSGAVPSLIVCAAIAFNPAYFMDSASWGQADSVLCLLLSLSVYYGVKGNWQISLPVYALALLCKPQAMLCGPIGLLAVVIDCVRNRSSIRRALIGAVFAGVLIYAISAPFAYYEGVWRNESSMFLFILKWPWDRLLGTATSQNKLSASALNFFCLIGQMGRQSDGVFLTWLGRAFLLLIYLYAAFLCVGGKRLDGTRRNLALAGAVLMTTIFAFAPYMHERYLMPALPLIALACIEHGDRRLAGCFALAMFLQFTNITMALSAMLDAHYRHPASIALNYIILRGLSLIVVLSALYLCWVAYDIIIRKHIRVFAIKENTDNTGGQND